MGYSCTVAADNTLAALSHDYATNGNPNILTIHGKQYFFECGREQPDGSITGRLMVMLPGNLCQSVGQVRINGIGVIERFPALKVRERVECEYTARDMEARNPALLRQWSIGRI